ncbi:Membrane-bound lytic murein transglycosylase D precursor [hydrothermal vent metagenome]|uniref:Membrane-bound lytic murein transglycosylase D n=1 Tax=hydrothermal vent metagenome TaxID=652676 RepID=A0A1W1CCA8_9ZZZZ
MKWVRHKIKKGDSLNLLAKKYNTTISALKTANKLKNNHIQLGKYLIIPIPQKKRNYYSLSEDSRQKIRFKIQREGKKIIHKVKKGDSLWLIARENNIHIQDIIKWNKISPKDHLIIGQKLVLWRPKSIKTKSITEIMQHQPNIKRKINYSVRNNENLSSIANKFKVSIKQIKKWNKLKKNTLQPKQKLIIFVDVLNLKK